MLTLLETIGLKEAAMLLLRAHRNAGSSRIIALLQELLNAPYLPSLRLDNTYEEPKRIGYTLQLLKLFRALAHA